MARLPHLCLTATPQYIIQRGNSRQTCFGSEEDFAAYAHWLAEYSHKYRVSIHAWVFMTSHVNLLATSESEDGISRMMQMLGRHYVRYFNYCYKRSGTLWEGRFKSCVVDEENYLLACQRYIELKPVRAGMVKSPDEYVWSSYRANGLGQNIKLWTPHSVYLELGQTQAKRTEVYRELFKVHLDEKLVQQIRQSTNQCMALGNERFMQVIERLTGKRVSPLKRGPNPKCKNEEEF